MVVVLNGLLGLFKLLVSSVGSMMFWVLIGLVEWIVVGVFCVLMLFWKYDVMIYVWVLLLICVVLWMLMLKWVCLGWIWL